MKDEIYNLVKKKVFKDEDDKFADKVKSHINSSVLSEQVQEMVMKTFKGTTLEGVLDQENDKDVFSEVEKLKNSLVEAKLSIKNLDKKMTMIENNKTSSNSLFKVAFQRQKSFINQRKFNRQNRNYTMINQSASSLVSFS